jgi:hypothetical protein
MYVMRVNISLVQVILVTLVQVVLENMEIPSFFSRSDLRKSEKYGIFLLLQEDYQK